MEITSTSKMMQIMNHGKKSSGSKATPIVEEDAETYEQNKKSLSYAPVPKNAAEMEQALVNSLANNLSNISSPME